MSGIMERPTIVQADKHPALIVRSASRSWQTPTALFFVRNHGTVPAIDPDAYRLTVRGRIERPLSLSLDDLRHTFPQHRVTAALQCAGNRRQEMLAVADIPGELPGSGTGICRYRCRRGPRRLHRPG